MKYGRPSLIHPECDCSCHQGLLNHIMSCCNECPYCKKLVRHVYTNSHINECRERFTDLINNEESN